MHSTPDALPDNLPRIPHETVADFSIEHRTWPRSQPRRLHGDALDFARADPALGRFRNSLLTALKHFVANARRAALAKKRHPTKGFAFIDDSAFEEEHPAALKHTETPDEIFLRTWLKELTLRVLKRLEQDCRESGQETHYQLFRRYLVAPALEGVDAPHLRDLGVAAGLTAKDVANRVLTVQRAFRRLLKEELAFYASSDEEAAEELRDLKRFLAR